VPEGFRSMAFSVVYREAGRTLKDAEVEAEHGELRLGLEKKGYTLR
jgi:phenylalanyl-tRNA synthetase beta subunit